MIKHNKSLDKNKKLAELAAFYDQSDITEEFDLKKAKHKKAKIKRVNMQIPFALYYEALKFGKISGSGYQNTLKIAILLGLKQLEKSFKKRS